MLRVLCLTALLGTVAAFENAVTERPQIECGLGKISLRVATSSEAPSHIFAKGHFNKEGCSFQNSTHVTFDFDNCDVSRKREVNPRGMSYSMTVVVQLHPLFITRVDRAYHVRCFYMEADKTVGSNLSVAPITETPLISNVSMPTCEYSLHKETPNGPKVKFAQVGDLIYHVWECRSDMYGMFVHDCTILDGQGNEHKVIDETGCSTDDFLMPNLVYANDLTKTFTQANAFNFPDQNTVYFNCQIRLCNKVDDGCKNISPPRCSTTEPADPLLTGELDTDQLVTSTHLPLDATTGQQPSSFAAEMLNSTIRLFTSTTQTPSTASSTASTTSTTPLPPSTTTAALLSTSTVVTTTVTELTSATTGVPETTTVILPRDFPTEDTLKDFIARKYGKLEDHFEGSGEATESTSTQQPTTVPLILGNEELLGDTTTTVKREIRRREAVDKMLDMDITSPELTIVDKDFGEFRGAELAEALKSESEASPQERDSSVCIPLLGFWLLGIIGILCCCVIVASLFYAQRQRDKFQLMA